MDRPVTKAHIDIDSIITLCEIYFDEIEHGAVKDNDDFEHDLFKEILNIIYGKDVFKWINEKIN